jgi:hypothetical protein
MPIRFDKLLKIISFDLSQAFKDQDALKQLKSSVIHLKELLQNPGKNYQTLLKHYKEEILITQDHVSKISKNLFRLIKRLRRRLDREKGGKVYLNGTLKRRRIPLTPKEIQHLEAFKCYLQECRRNIKSNLLKGGELNKLIKAQNWDAVVDKINECLGTTPNPGILYLEKLLMDLSIEEQHLKELYSSYDLITKPDGTSLNTILGFQGKILVGNEVTPIGLKDRINNATLLGLHYENGKLIAVGGIKGYAPSYRNGLFKKAGVPKMARKYNYEMGWLFTHANYRRKGYSILVIKKLLLTHGKKDLFTTVREDNVPAQSFIRKFGFVQIGSSYKSFRGDYKICLFILK